MFKWFNSGVWGLFVQHKCHRTEQFSKSKDVSSSANSPGAGTPFHPQTLCCRSPRASWSVRLASHLWGQTLPKPSLRGTRGTAPVSHETDLAFLEERKFLVLMEQMAAPSSRRAEIAKNTEDEALFYLLDESNHHLPPLCLASGCFLW